MIDVTYNIEIGKFMCRILWDGIPSLSQVDAHATCGTASGGYLQMVTCFSNWMEKVIQHHGPNFWDSLDPYDNFSFAFKKQFKDDFFLHNYAD